jgi:hypothetical protein
VALTATPSVRSLASPPNTAAVRAAGRVEADTFRASAVGAARPYGVGRPQLALLPGGVVAADGSSALLAVQRSDVVGRVGVLAEAAFGSASTWRGGSFGVAWRRFRPTVRADAFAAAQRPSAQRAVALTLPALDVDYRGGAVGVDFVRVTPRGDAEARVAGSAGSLRPRGGGVARRALVATRLWVTRSRVRAGRYAKASVTGEASAGRTASATWERALARAALAVGGRGAGLSVAGAYGTVARRAPAFEQFAVGGAAPALIDEMLLGQRLTQPALPLGVAAGRRVASYQVALGSAPLSPYYWAASSGERLDTWHRVVGLDGAVAFGPFPLLRLPEVRLRAGVGRSLDEPFKRKTRGYLSLAYRP